MGATVSEAAKCAGVGRQTVYDRLNRDQDFKAKFDDAIEEGTDAIEQAATFRAIHGVEEPVIYKGQVQFVGIDKDGNPCDPCSPLAVKNVPLTVRKPSDVLAIFLLKGRRPQKYRDNIDVTSGGQPLYKVLKGVSQDDL